MTFVSEKATVYNSDIGQLVRIYDGASIRESVIADYSIVGNDAIVYNSNLSPHVSINRRNIIDNVVIGDYTYTGVNTSISHCVIGKYCSIAASVMIGSGEHDYHKLSTHPFRLFSKYGFFETGEREEGYESFKSELNIGNDVWVGHGALILRSCHSIGDGAIIGAGAIVTNDVFPYSIVVGSPAREIGKRFNDQIIQQLLDLQWWSWPYDTIHNNLNLFDEDVTPVNLEHAFQIKNQIKECL